MLSCKRLQRTLTYKPENSLQALKVIPASVGKWRERGPRWPPPTPIPHESLSIVYRHYTTYANRKDTAKVWKAVNSNNKPLDLSKASSNILGEWPFR